MSLFLALKTFPFNKNNRIDIKTQMTLKIPERVSSIFDKPGLALKISSPDIAKTRLKMIQMFTNANPDWKKAGRLNPKRI
ncbi:MAG: hypothetical protein PHY99_05580 [Bacteroidales bacterium]|nr:hypothetical protein [Bacteroidales bacterium]